MSDDMDLDLVTLTERLARRDVSALEVTEHCLERIERLDPSLNAFRQIQADHARDQAKSSDRRRRRVGLLDGVPVAVKDNIDIAGLVTRSGLGQRNEHPAARDADVVAELRRAGAIILGHTNMHEGALGATNDNPHYGRTHNPWRLGYTPGGSSGGSAAAVAAGFCTLALGTDTLGSVRLPAAYCGIAGYKPSRGKISNAGIEPLCRELDQVGPLARSVAGLRLAVEMLIGPAAMLRDVDIGSLRCARLVAFDDIGTSVDVESAFDEALTALRSMGVDVQSAGIEGYDPGRTRRAGLLLVEAEAARHFAGDRQNYPLAFSPGFTSLLDYGAGANAERLDEAANTVERVRKGFAAMFQEIDILLAPTAPQPAFPFAVEAPANQADLTAIANFAGAPAVSLPMASSPGLPVGLQVIGRHGSDALVLAVAEQLERTLPFNLPDLPRELCP